MLLFVLAKFPSKTNFKTDIKDFYSKHCKKFIQFVQSAIKNVSVLTFCLKILNSHVILIIQETLLFPAAEYFETNRKWI